MKKQKQTKIEYSKIWVLVTGILFIWCLYEGFNSKLSTAVDATVFVAAITISGGIFGSTIVWYYKKAQAENVIKIKTNLYESLSQIRLKFNIEMMKAKKKYSITDEEISDIESNSDVDEFMQESVESAQASVNDALNSATSEIEIQNY